MHSSRKGSSRPKLIKSFNETYPSVSYRVLAGDPYDLREQLESRNIELALVRFPMEMKGLATFHLSRGPFVFVVPKDWQTFHSKDAIKMKEVENIPLLLIHRTKGEGVCERIIEECKRFGIQPTIVCECSDVNILLSLVAQGIGASIIPKSSVSPNLYDEIKVLDILDTSLESETALVWLEDQYLSKAAKRFMEMF